MSVSKQSAPGNWRYISRASQTDEVNGPFIMVWFRVIDGDDGEEVHDEVRLARFPHMGETVRVVAHTAPPRAKKNITRGDRTTNRVLTEEFDGLGDALEFSKAYMRSED